MENEQKQTQRQNSAIKKLMLVISAFIFLAAAGALFWLLMPPSEPEYNGRTLTQWITNCQVPIILGDLKDTNFLESRDAIQHMGTNVIPALLQMLKESDSESDMTFLEYKLMLREKLHLPIPLSTKGERRELAQYGFVCLGDMATNAVPELLRFYKSHAGADHSDVDRGHVNMVLMNMYPAPCVAGAEWVPREKRAGWFMATGTVQLQRGAISNAILAYSESIKLNPTNAEGYLNRGNAKLASKDFHGAVDDVNEFLTFNTNEHSAFYTRGLCEFFLKDFKTAEADLTKSIDLYTNAWLAYDYRGLARANLRKLDDALDDFDSALRVNPQDSQAYRNRAMVENMQKDLEAALDDISAAIRWDPSDPVVYAARGHIHMRLKEYELARADFDKAISMSPNEPMLYASRAGANVSLNEFAKVEADLEKSFEANPNIPNALIVRGMLRMKQGRDTESLADYQRCLELTSQPEIYGMVGLMQYKTGDRQSALANCRKALKQGVLAGVDDCCSTIWFIRAQSGDLEGANAEMNAWLKTVPKAKTNEWDTIVAQYLTGSVTESNFLRLATTSAKRPSAVKVQICESFDYAGMKHKVDGDKQGSRIFFQKCVDTKYDNSFAYFEALDELKATERK